MSSNDFSQLINEPSYIQTNSSSCIDLIFTNQSRLSVNSRVHSSLHPICHHQIAHTSFNLDIYHPSPYQWLIWDYKKTDSMNRPRFRSMGEALIKRVLIHKLLH